MNFLAWGLFFIFQYASADVAVRSETPNPQLERAEWISLNGPWNFGYGDEGPRNFGQSRTSELPFKIVVPFAPETTMSGIGNAEFEPEKDVVWYQRQVAVPATWDGRALLHFAAVDYEAEVFVNGKFVAHHRGGYAPFSVDLTGLISGDHFELQLRAYDPATSTQIARGKQEILRHEGNIFYDKSTGIRDSVWIERIENAFIRELYFLPKVDGQLTVEAEVAYANTAKKDPLSVEISVLREGQTVVSARASVKDGKAIMTMKVDDVQLWSPESPSLYTVTAKVLRSKVRPSGLKNRVVDTVQSYTGFKSIEKINGQIYLNGKALVQKLVLDQGYYPASGYTPANVSDMETDIKMAQAMGLNGARFHQQPPTAYKRYLADKLGYLYWIEMPSARDLRDSVARENFHHEAAELFKNHRNGVGFIVGVGYNETWGLWEMSPQQKGTEQVALARTVLPLLPPEVMFSPNDGWEQISGVDQSGNPVVELADISNRFILALHDYPERGQWLRDVYGDLHLEPKPGMHVPRGGGQGAAAFAEGYGYDPRAVAILSEYGGATTYFVEGELPNYLFGYHQIERQMETAFERIFDHITVAHNVRFFNGNTCYTQLRDTKFEKNGLLYETGEPKFLLDLFLRRPPFSEEIQPTKDAVAADGKMCYDVFAK